MHNQKLYTYIQLYKNHFEEVNQMELYKWRAVRHFQKHWDIDAPNFHEMLQNALALTFNLLDAGLYYPRTVLLQFVHDNPELLRQCFRDLFNEDNDINERILAFKHHADTLVGNYEFNNHYQDHRAIMVYLSLMYPDRYFLYKFGMFNSFSKAVEYDYAPVMGRIENIGQWQTLCKLVRHELSTDEELVLLHQNRHMPDCYADTALNILTQDFIYAVAQHLPAVDYVNNVENVVIDEEMVTMESIQLTPANITFQPFTTNFLENNKENKRIGDLGELWILDYERKKLREANLHNLASRVRQDSKEKGDGLGYDIFSYDLTGNEIFIEVKTSTGAVNTPFYLTATELARSVVDADKYFVYRVYQFNEMTKTGSIKIIAGDMTSLCVNPVQYKIQMV
jgi:hypothetical protein